METLRKYLERKAEYDKTAVGAMPLLQQAEEEQRNAVAAMDVTISLLQAQLTTLQAAVREYFEAEKFPVGKLPPTNSRIRYVAAEQALRKAVE